MLALVNLWNQLSRKNAASAKIKNESFKDYSKIFKIKDYEHLET